MLRQRYAFALSLSTLMQKEPPTPTLPPVADALAASARSIVLLAAIFTSPLTPRIFGLALVPRYASTSAPDTKSASTGGHGNAARRTGLGANRFGTGRGLREMSMDSILSAGGSNQCAVLHARDDVRAVDGDGDARAHACGGGFCARRKRRPRWWNRS